MPKGKNYCAWGMPLAEQDVEYWGNSSNVLHLCAIGPSLYGFVAFMLTELWTDIRVDYPFRATARVVKAWAIKSYK
jgi:hypothetical protein